MDLSEVWLSVNSFQKCLFELKSINEHLHDFPQMIF